MTNGLQHDFVLLDRSGSMCGPLWNEALNSVNSYVKKLAEEKVDTGVTLAVFDTGSMGNLDFQVIRDRIIPSTWKTVTSDEVSPRNSTPLNDATAKLIALAEAGNYEKVVLVIMTDGHENASREYTVKQIKDRLDACRLKEWVVIFLGANFDNAAQAASYGNHSGNTAIVASGMMRTATESLGSKRMLYAASGVAATMSFTEDEKTSLKVEAPKSLTSNVTAQAPV